MRYKRLTIAILLFAVTIFLRCTDGQTEIGGEWVKVHTRVLMIDTCTVDISSVRLDSIPTSGGGRVFAGARQSSFWGTTTASTYMTFHVTSNFTGIHSEVEYKEDIRFDSLTLYMLPDSMFCGDTLQMTTFRLYRLAEQVELNDDGKLYAHSSFAHESAPLVEYSYRPRPLRGKEVEIRLPDRLGEEFLNLLVDKDDTMTDDENFRKYFKGILLDADPESGAIMGFKASDTTCLLKLYYRIIGYTEAEEHVADFKIDTSLMFTHLEIDRTGTPLDGIGSRNEEIHSRYSDHIAFAQGLTGIYTKIGFPHLNNLRGLGNYCTAVSAELVVYPLAGSYNKQNYSSLPPTLNLFESDENNISTGGAIVDDSGENLQSGSLTYDEQFPERTFYTYDITDFVNDQLGKIGVNKRFLQMIDPNFGYTLDELVVGDQTRHEKNIELRLKYAIYNEK